MSVLDRARRLVRGGQYEVTEHAVEKADRERLGVRDIKEILLKGRVAGKYGRKGTERRYRVEGRSVDGRDVAIVIRFTEMGDLRVVTVFEVR